MYRDALVRKLAPSIHSRRSLLYFRILAAPLSSVVASRRDRTSICPIFIDPDGQHHTVDFSSDRPMGSSNTLAGEPVNATETVALQTRRVAGGWGVAPA